MTNLKPVKTTFMFIGSNNNKVNTIMETIKTDHEVFITKTDLINMAIDVFLKSLESEEKSITDYLIQYHKL